MSSRSNRLLGSMSMAMSVILTLLGFLNGCQTLQTQPHGMVAEQNRVPLVESGKDSGVWKGLDLSVQYQVSRSEGEVSLSGKVSFESSVTNNYNQIEYFHLAVIFLDEKGTVLDMRGVVSGVKSDPDDSQPFSAIVVAPRSAKAMAFSYQIKAQEGGNSGGGGGVRDFFFYPIQ